LGVAAARREKFSLHGGKLLSHGERKEKKELGLQSQALVFADERGLALVFYLRFLICYTLEPGWGKLCPSP
jgi:hypothetical protein